MNETVEFKPIFENQKEKLWSRIIYIIGMIKNTLFEKYGIREDRLLEKASEEFEIIENEGMVGLYYLMAKSLHDAGVVHLSEIVTYGAGNASVICNLLGLSGGLGAIKRIAYTLNGTYFTELFYGPSDARLSFNPTNVRMSRVVYKRFIEAFIDNLKNAINTDIYMGVDFKSFDTQRKFGLYFLEDDNLDKLAYLSIRYPGDVHGLIEDDEDILNLICNRDNNNRYEYKIIPESYYNVITKVAPRDKEELSYAIAIATILSKPDHLITHIDRNLYSNHGRNPFTDSYMRVFAEDYLKEYIDGSHGVSFMRQRKICMMNQIFNKAHIDRMVDSEWLYATLYNKVIA